MFPFDLALHEAAQTSAQHPGWVNTRKALKKLLNAKAHQARPASQKNQAETAGVLFLVQDFFFLISDYILSEKGFILIRTSGIMFGKYFSKSSNIYYYMEEP